jgi:outer membrane receptor protein involved in Fe transport
MYSNVSGLLACCLIFSACLSATVIKGTVVDPSGAPVVGAQVSVLDRVGVRAQTATSPSGAFEVNGPDTSDARIVITAPGFNTETLPVKDVLAVKLSIAPLVDSVSVVGSAVDAPASEQGGSVSLVPREEVRQRNEPYAMDLLRYLPGMAFNQTGPPGGVSSLFLRGADSDFSLVQIDGVPVNWLGGAFDFAHIPSEALDHIEVIRGPQSAIYGPYANSGAINFVTRQPEAGPQLDLLAEGGSYRERRFGVTATDTIAGFGLLVSASRIDDDGPVVNSDYHNEDLLLNVTRHWAKQSLAFHGYFDTSTTGEPGPWGSDPKNDFTGIDTISREKLAFSEYGVHYEIALSDRVHQELFGGFFLENSGYTSPFGFSYDKEIRGQGEERTIVNVSRHYTAAIGVSAGREEVKNTYITDASSSVTPITRNDIAVYIENRFEFGKLFLNAGIRGEWINTPSIPTDGFSRPFFPANTISRANPKLAATYVEGATRFHASVGTGIRPPSGFELAFTTNPQLQPERTRSVDGGIEQKLFGNRLLLDGTYFYNRYYDLIVSLGGSLSTLSHYTTANLANSRAQGAEFSASLHPVRWIFVRGSYTLLGTRILSLNGTPNQAPLPFQVGQELTRRPENSGSVVSSFTRGRITAAVTGYFRGRTLYEEPTYGATDGLFWNPGYANVGINVNYALGHGLTAYGNLRNALNWHYEEVFGYPSPRLNFVSGFKWTLARAK